MPAFQKNHAASTVAEYVQLVQALDIIDSNSLKPLDPKTIDDFGRIWWLLDDEVRVNAFLDDLSTRVQKQIQIVKNLRSGAQGVLKSYSDEGILGVALHDVLRETEIAQGFSKDRVYFLEGVLEAFEFLEMMDQRIPFMDPRVNRNHGAQTHRIQWWIVGEDMKANKGFWNAPSAGDLYLVTATARKRDFRSGNDTLWYKSFDAQRGGPGQPQTARCPEFLLTHIESTDPTFLYRAELCAQEWNANTPKDRSENLQNIRITSLDRMAEVKWKKPAPPKPKIPLPPKPRKQDAPVVAQKMPDVGKEVTASPQTINPAPLKNTTVAVVKAPTWDAQIVSVPNRVPVTALKNADPPPTVRAMPGRLNFVWPPPPKT
ncbi:MAG: LirA/MavJ family T4SS effector [Burkholderiales bacterium]